jgi:hypothetical protein
MPSINYNTPQAQAGFQVRNLLEGGDLPLRFPHRYWMTMSINAETTSKWEAQAHLNDVSIMDVWDQQIRSYFQKIATAASANVIAVWGVDNLQSFHSVALTNSPIILNNWLDSWPFARQRWVDPFTGEEIKGKMIDTYDASGNAIPYIFHHHQASVHYFRHRPRGRRKCPPVVTAIDEIIQSMALPALDGALIKSEPSAPTFIVSSVQSHK